MPRNSADLAIFVACICSKWAWPRKLLHAATIISYRLTVSRVFYFLMHRLLRARCAIIQNVLKPLRSTSTLLATGVTWEAASASVSKLSRLAFSSTAVVLNSLPVPNRVAIHQWIRIESIQVTIRVGGRSHWGRVNRAILSFLPMKNYATSLSRGQTRTVCSNDTLVDMHLISDFFHVNQGI